MSKIRNWRGVGKITVERHREREKLTLARANWHLPPSLSWISIISLHKDIIAPNYPSHMTSDIWHQDCWHCPPNCPQGIYYPPLSTPVAHSALSLLCPDSQAFSLPILLFVTWSLHRLYNIQGGCSRPPASSFLARGCHRSLNTLPTFRFQILVLRL